MTLTDRRGVAVSTSSHASLERLETATDLFHGYFGDPIATIDKALAEDPHFVMGHCFRAGVLATCTDKTLEPELRASVEAAETLWQKANERERGHIAAARAWLDGDIGIAVERWSSVLLEAPRDSLALQFAHLGDFLLGQSSMLRDRVARVLPDWDEGVAGFGYVLGMYAFGLEETALYGQAEETARRAVELNPRDPWAIHAGAHVMEMQGRQLEGIRWLTEREGDWSIDNAFAFHNWWHLALYHLDLGDTARVLALYDSAIRPRPSSVVLEMIDASAMLWRLHLRGVDVGTRWRELAQSWVPTAEHGYYAFNDFHAMMAFVASGDVDGARTLLATLDRAASAGGTNGMMSREVGLPLCRALEAFGCGDYGRAVELLQSVRCVAQRFGGSHAQRDIIHLTLVEAARRAGQQRLARALAAERSALKPSSPSTAPWRSASSAPPRQTGGKRRGTGCIHPAMRTKRPSFPGEEIPAMKPTARPVRLSSGVELRCVERGSRGGVPMVFLHGVTDSWRSFEGVLPLLPASIRAFALTQRGHGDADKPPAGYRTRDFAADLAAFLDAMEIERAVVVGHSMGTTNALRFAIDHPARTLGLVLAGTFASYRGNPAIVDFCENVIAPLTDPIDPALAREFQQSTLAQPVPAALLETVVSESLKTPARVWRAAFRGFLEDDFTDELGRVEAPTLILWGARDGFCPRADQETLLAQIPGARLAEYAHAGHALHWEEPERFAADVVAFVERCAGGSRGLAGEGDLARAFGRMSAGQDAGWLPPAGHGRNDQTVIGDDFSVDDVDLWLPEVSGSSPQ